MSREEHEGLEHIVSKIKEAGRRAVPEPGARERVWNAARKEIQLAGTRGRRRTLVLLLPIAAALLLFVSVGALVWIERSRQAPPAPPAVAEPLDWPMWGRKPSGSFRARTAEIAPPFETLWRYVTEGSHSGKPAQCPVTCGSTVFITKHVGTTERVVALDAATGRERWVSGEATLGYLAADGERVYAMRRHLGSIAVMALGVDDGAVKWTSNLTTRGSSFWHPILVRESLCVGAGDALAVLDAKTGEKMWRWNAAESGELSPVRPVACGCANRLYVVTTDESLHAIGLRTGKKVWAKSLKQADGKQAQEIHLAYSEGRVYTLQTYGEIDKGPATLSCHLGRDGSSPWRADAASAMYVIAAGGMVYTKGMDLTAYRADGGTQVWKRTLGSCAPITCAGRQVYAMNQPEGKPLELLALSAGSGRDVWKSPIDKSCIGLILTGRTGLLAGLDGTLRALRLGGIPAGKDGA
jgi:outer membrane protein assembly factor BamB